MTSKDSPRTERVNIRARQLDVMTLTHSVACLLLDKSTISPPVLPSRPNASINHFCVVFSYKYNWCNGVFYSVLGWLPNAQKSFFINFAFVLNQNSQRFDI